MFILAGLLLAFTSSLRQQIDAPNRIEEMFFSRNGHYLGVFSPKNNFLYDIQEHRKIAIPGVYLSSVSFDGSRVAVIDPYSGIDVWDVKERKYALRIESKHMGDPALRPDGQQIVFTPKFELTSDSHVIEVISIANGAKKTYTDWFNPLAKLAIRTLRDRALQPLKDHIPSVADVKFSGLLIRKWNSNGTLWIESRFEAGYHQTQNIFFKMNLRNQRPFDLNPGFFHAFLSDGSMLGAGPLENRDPGETGEDVNLWHGGAIARRLAHLPNLVFHNGDGIGFATAKAAPVALAYGIMGAIHGGIPLEKVTPGQRLVVYVVDAKKQTCKLLSSVPCSVLDTLMALSPDGKTVASESPTKKNEIVISRLISVTSDK